MQRFMLKIRVGIATHRGLGRPMPPLLVDMLLMRCACRGIELRLVSPVRNLSWNIVPEVPVVRKLGCVANDISSNDMSYFVGGACIE